MACRIDDFVDHRLQYRRLATATRAHLPQPRLGDPGAGPAVGGKQQRFGTAAPARPGHSLVVGRQRLKRLKPSRGESRGLVNHAGLHIEKVRPDSSAARAERVGGHTQVNGLSPIQRADRG